MSGTTRTRQVTFWASAGVLVLAVIAALVVFLVPLGSPKPADPGATKPTASSSSPVADGIGCKAPPSDDRRVPADLRWKVSQGVTWPVSATVGPTTTTDGFPACFAHSPVGAALAAVTMLYAQIDHSPLSVGKFYLADSPGKSKLLQETKAGTPSQLKSQLESNGISLVGFQVEEYGNKRAAIRLILRIPGSLTGYRGLPYPMQWTNGDWKVYPLDTGSTGQPSDSEIGSFTYWTAAGNG